MATLHEQTQQRTITCHCKAIRLTFPPLREPANECMCSICRRYGALWAYYKVEEVQIEDDGNALEGHCGCMTHYSILRQTETEPEPRIAVNCRMMEREEYERLESEQSDGD